MVCEPPLLMTLCVVWLRGCVLVVVAGIGVKDVVDLPATTGQRG